MRCIVWRRVNNRYVYLTNRRSTSVMYVNKSTWSDDIDQAKVFQNQSAAVRSARHNLGHDGFEIDIVQLKILLTLDRINY